MGDEGEDHLEGVGAIVVIGFWEVAQLVDELCLVPAESDDAVGWNSGAARAFRI